MTGDAGREEKDEVGELIERGMKGFLGGASSVVDISSTESSSYLDGACC